MTPPSRSRRGDRWSSPSFRRFRGKRWMQRLDIANYELTPALRVAHPDVVKDKRVLVIDDVYTEGLTIRAVAKH